jgi:hypothetical protein
MNIVQNIIVLIAGTVLATVFFHVVVIGGFTVYHLMHS